MTEDEFRALLAIEGKTLEVQDVSGLVYTAVVVIKNRTVTNLTYAKTKQEAIQNIIKIHYADN